MLRYAVALFVAGFIVCGADNAAALELPKDANTTCPVMTKEEVDKLYETLQTFDLSLQVEKLNERPLLLWHGDNDPTVPFEHSFRFYESTVKVYKDQDKIKFIREKNQGHKVSRMAILETVKWFVSYL